jgi:hypothetical protein
MLRLAATMGGPSEEAISRMETERERADGETSSNAAGTPRKRGRLRASSKPTPAENSRSR